jgi:predicted AAA+ superfamily ATPase
MYLEVINNKKGEEKEVLKNLINSYLYKDILAHAKIRKPEVLKKLF